MVMIGILAPDIYCDPPTQGVLGPSTFVAADAAFDDLGCDRILRALFAG